MRRTKTGEASWHGLGSSSPHRAIAGDGFVSRGSLFTVRNVCFSLVALVGLVVIFMSRGGGNIQYVMTLLNRSKPHMF